LLTVFVVLDCENAFSVNILWQFPNPKGVANFYRNFRDLSGALCFSHAWHTQFYLCE